MSDDAVTVGRDEQEVQQIEVALEVERLDTFLFRSKTLNIPYLARGAFGGQVISQALVSASQCVNAKYLLHSLHCYFLLSVTPAVPVLYYITNIRDGKSYSTRVVRAVQNGKTVFYMICSYHTPEPGQPVQQWPMPLVKTPEQSQREEEFLLALADRPEIGEKHRNWYCRQARDRAMSPIDVRLPGNQTNDDGKPVHMYWMKTREKHNWQSPFQKCILAYISDLHFIGAASYSAGLRRIGTGSNRLAMSSSLDHAITYYDHDFDCSEWMLYVVDSPAVGWGRGFVRGMMFSQQGKLLAVMSQEGVVRAQRADSQAKL